MLIGCIGVVSGLLQRGYVRSAMSKIGEDRMAQRGFASCAVAFFLLSLVPLFAAQHHLIAVLILHAAALFLAITSATVVTSLTAYTSLQCDQEFPNSPCRPTRPAPLAASPLHVQSRASHYHRSTRAVPPLCRSPPHPPLRPFSLHSPSRPSLLHSPLPLLCCTRR